MFFFEFCSEPVVKKFKQLKLVYLKIWFPSSGFSLVEILYVLLAGQVVFSQEKAAGSNDSNAPSQKKARQIELLNANSLEYDESLGNRAKRLIGNVALKHEGTYMYCDSAHLFSEENRFDAYGHIHIKPQGSSDLYGDSMRYFGNTQMANIRGAVRFIDKEFSLTTTALDYNVESDLAYYMNGGTIVNSNDSSTLRSLYGYFYPKQNEFYFKKNVEVVHPDYVINSDTLNYNTETKITSFLGPTTIKGKNSFIYCETGQHDSRSNISRFGKNAYMENEKQKLNGDSIIYDRNLSLGRAIGNVSLVDTSENLIISGDLLTFYEKDSISLVTGHAMLTQFEKNDTLYLHADTLLSKYDSALTRHSPAGIGETRETEWKGEGAKARTDTLPPDSVNNKKRLMLAYHHVSFFKTDMQGKCDSLVFSNVDSAIRMFDKPVIWSNENQMTAEYIEIRTFSGQVERMLFDKNAFIISEVDPDSLISMLDTMARFNQIKGEKMVGHFDSGKLAMIDVLQKGETVYFAMEDKKTSPDSLVSDSLVSDSLAEEDDIIGVNLADCDSMVIHLKDNKVKKISFRGNVNAALHPIDQIAYKETLLEGFNWKGKYRPKKKEDIFLVEKE